MPFVCCGLSVCCMFSVGYCLLCVAYCLLSVFYCMLSIVCYFLSVVYSRLSLVYCQLYVVCYHVFIVYYLLSIGYSLLFIVFFLAPSWWWYYPSTLAVMYRLGALDFNPRLDVLPPLRCIRVYSKFFWCYISIFFFLLEHFVTLALNIFLPERAFGNNSPKYIYINKSILYHRPKNNFLPAQALCESGATYFSPGMSTL